MPAGIRDAARSLIAALIITGLASAAPHGGWHQEFASAQADAKRLDRPILVHFSAEWCGPCKRMDREVLHNRSFLDSLGRQVVPVKVDVDRDRELARRYQVESVPTDLFLTPDGRVLGVMNGFRSPEDYLSRVAAVDRQYGRQKELFFALSEGDASHDALGGELGPHFPTLKAPEPDAPEPDRTKSTPSEGGPRPNGPVLKPRTDGTVLVGLKGHCPVTLYWERKWVKGNSRFRWEHQGLTYFLATGEDQEKFRMEAERYAPRLLGCDPVLYFDEGRAVPGSTSFAVYFEEVLYLFASPETRSRFRETPERYTRRQTVLLLDEMESLVR